MEPQLPEISPGDRAREIEPVYAGDALEDLFDGIAHTADYDQVALDGLSRYAFHRGFDLRSREPASNTVENELDLFRHRALPRGTSILILILSSILVNGANLGE